MACGLDMTFLKLGFARLMNGSNCAVHAFLLCICAFATQILSSSALYNCGCICRGVFINSASKASFRSTGFHGRQYSKEFPRLYR
eukprot:2769639-Pleurochrysis_carterae.AAC.2